MSQADDVKRIMAKAGMAKPTDLYIAYLSKDEAADYDDPVARPGPRSGTNRTRGRCLAATWFLPGCVKPSSWPPPPLSTTSRSSARVPRAEAVHACGWGAAAHCCEPGRHPRHDVGSSREAVGRATHRARDPEWVRGQWKQQTAQFRSHAFLARLRVRGAFSAWATGGCVC